MAHRFRLTPPPHLSHLKVKLVGGTVDRDILIRQGWALVVAEGMASTDPPEAIQERMKAVETMTGGTPGNPRTEWKATMEPDTKRPKRKRMGQ